MQKVVLISQQGSGSNLLRALLNSHPDIIFMDELFCNRDKRPSDWKKSGKSIPDFFNDLYRKHEDKKIFGWDLKYNQMDASIISYIKHSDYKVIHLRRNAGRTFLRRINNINKTFTVAQLTDHCKRVREWELYVIKHFAGDGHNFHKINYEFLTEGDEIKTTHKRYLPTMDILAFLGLEPRELFINEDKYINKPLKIRY